MRITIGRRIILGFGAAVAVTGVLGLFTWNTLRAIDTATQDIVGRCLPAAYLAGEIKEQSRRNYALTLQHILETDKQEMDRVEQSMQAQTEEVQKAFKEFERLPLSARERELFARIPQSRSAFMETRGAVLALSVQGDKQSAADLLEKQGKPLLTAYQEATGTLLDFEREAGLQAGRDISAAVADGTRGVIVALILAVVSAGGIGFVIVRGANRLLTRMANTLGEGSNQVAAAAAQVSSASQSLAQGASEQAAALEETTSALEEMSSMTRKNAEAAEQATALAGEAQAAAAKSNQAMQKMDAAIGEIQKSATETAKIIKAIDEIAFQTNLLALNAAVEAARAGEAGKGFAVVAEEVRNLAMRSAEAAKSTAVMIEESVTSARNGVAISTRVAKTLDEITTAATKVNTLIAEIAAANQEQSQGCQQVSTAIGQMDVVTQQNAAGAEESAAAAEELSGQAEQLSGVVGELIQLVGAANRQPLERAPLRHAARAGPRWGTPPGAGKPSAAAGVRRRAGVQIPLDAADDGEPDFSDFNARG